jgi:hypothetical protein
MRRSPGFTSVSEFFLILAVELPYGRQPDVGQFFFARLSKKELTVEIAGVRILLK